MVERTVFFYSPFTHTDHNTPAYRHRTSRYPPPHGNFRYSPYNRLEVQFRDNTSREDSSGPTASNGSEAPKMDDGGKMGMGRTLYQ